jgi:hypothetical protein
MTDFVGFFDLSTDLIRVTLGAVTEILFVCFMEFYMNKVLSFFAVACAIGASSSVATADPLMQYNYVDAAYQWTSFDDDDVDFDNGNGFDGKLSFSPMKHVAIEGGYNYTDTAVLDQNLALNTFSYGIAGWYDMCDNIHLVGRVGGLHSDLDGNSVLGNDATDGVYAGGQLRYLWTDTFESNVDITYINYTDAGADWNYGLTGLFTVADNVALKVGTAISDEADVSVLGGVRLTM